MKLRIFTLIDLPRATAYMGLREFKEAAGYARDALIETVEEREALTEDDSNGIVYYKKYVVE